MRTPPSSEARSPSMVPGPISATLLAVDLDREHAVEKEVEVMALRALLDQHLALVELAPREA